MRIEFLNHVAIPGRVPINDEHVQESKDLGSLSAMWDRLSQMLEQKSCGLPKVRVVGIMHDWYLKSRESCLMTSRRILGIFLFQPLIPGAKQ